MSDNNTVSTAPVAPSSNSSGSSSGSNPGTKNSGGGGGSGKKGGGGGGFDPYKDSIRRENEAKRKAAQKYRDQAKTLSQQIEALKIALGPKGFKNALDQKLANVMLNQRQQDSLLMEGYQKRVGTLAGAAKDNEKATADQSVAAVNNRGRERMNALSEAMLQGAGESDVLAAQQMSLRNWEANQSEVNRSFFDTLRSVNSSLTDLNVDTKGARVNNALEANADREQLWTNYYDQRSQTYTQMGNIRGQQAELYGLAHEAVGSKKNQGDKKKQNQLSAASGSAFTQAALTSGQAWKNPGIDKGLMQWQGQGDFKGQLNTSRLINSQAESPAVTRKVEGATLRKWDDE